MTYTLHSQDYIIRLKRGLAASINTTATTNAAVEAEPHYTTDTDTLYIFDGTLNRPAAAQWPVQSATGDIAATLASGVILVSATATITLPAATINKILEVKNTSAAATVTIDGDGAELVEGSATLEIYAGEAVTLASDGTGWYVI